jgi:hypothetical protein
MGVVGVSILGVGLRTARLTEHIFPHFPLSQVLLLASIPLAISCNFGVSLNCNARVLVYFCHVTLIFFYFFWNTFINRYTNTRSNRDGRERETREQRRATHIRRQT